MSPGADGGGGRATSEVVAVATREGPMRAIVARAAVAGPVAAVIAYPHVGGLTDTMRIMAEQVASGGYLCVVPDLYHRLGTIVLDPQSTDPDAIALRKVAAAAVTDAGAMADTRAVLEWLDSRPDVRSPGVGTIGYGRGGGLALRAAAEFPDRVRAAASVLGFGFAPDGRDAARSRLARISGGVYCAFAELDDIIPAAVPEELRSILDALTLDARLVVHPGTRHPYVFPDRAVHDAAASRRDWEAIFAMYARHLDNRARRERT